MTRSYKMQPCLKCGEPTKVRYARATTAGTFRRRRCPSCKFEFCTEELPVGTPKRSRMVISCAHLAKSLAEFGIDLDYGDTEA